MPYVNNDGIKIHYKIDGDGQPLMLVHGFAGSLENWYDYGYAQVLRKNYKLILVDARGHGRSDKPYEVGDYNAEVLANDFSAVLDGLGLEKAHYLGYSMGSNIAFRCIARHVLDRFDSFILGGGSPYGYVTEAEKQFGKAITANVEKAAKEGPKEWVSYLEKQGTTISQESRERYFENDYKALLAHRIASVNWSSATDILRTIQVSCLLFVGEADAYYGKNKEAVVSLPNANLVTFPNLNHGQCYRRSDIVLPHITKFLEELNK